MDAIIQARALAGASDVASAVASLELCGAAGNPQCWVELALWHLQARGVPRDIARARECFTEGAALGDRYSQMVNLSFLASGTGGPRDWPLALQLLGEVAETDRHAARLVELIAAMDLDLSGNPRGVVAGKIVGTRPDVRLFEQFLSLAECRYLSDFASDRFRPSKVGDATGKLRIHPVRTCDFVAIPWLDENPGDPRP